jgi:hypothetical protein
MHPKVELAIDEIDDMVFSGDTLVDSDEREKFKEILARWQRGVAEFEDFAKSEEDTTE